MSRHKLEILGLRRGTGHWATRSDRPLITWWPASLPGLDIDADQPRPPRRAPARKPLRRGRIQFVAA